MKRQDARQMELKGEYEALLRRYIWRDESMIEYCMKKAAHIVELADGTIIVIEKPSIEKDFCFGYTLNRYDTKEYDSANRLADMARKDTDMFMGSNLERIDGTIADLERANELTREYYKYIDNIRQPASCKLRSWAYRPLYVEYRPFCYEPLTEDDRARLAEGYKAVRVDFVKRLETYLKRYGLSKVHSWSYWADA